MQDSEHLDPGKSGADPGGGGGGGGGWIGCLVTPLRV